ncbi:MAG: PLP-dependent aminotransferase family protein [Leptospirales bacterium]|nr:PLP-dependent aminotransferase family protein [Leptospirales bacterium]
MDTMTRSEGLQRQIYLRLRNSILNGELAAGARLPGARSLARQNGISRNTVLGAYGQLEAEGYVNSRAASGVFVSDGLFLGAAQGALSPSAAALSRRGAQLASIPITRNLPGQRLQPLMPGSPDLAQAPAEELAKLQLRAARILPRREFGYADPAGYLPLRQALSAHLALARGVKARAAQLLIVSGSQQSLDLCARLLLDPGDLAIMENPGYRGALAAFSAAGAKVQGIAVDREGIDVESLRRRLRRQRLRLLYLTPSHQFPTGVTLALERRLELIRLAHEYDFLILEDDYDSDYQYAGRPLPSMQGLDPYGRVLYLGTLSKSLFPGLRLGFLAVPEKLAEAFASARALCDRHSAILPQAALAEYFRRGAYHRHIRRMRESYRRRRDTLLQACQRHLSDLGEVLPCDSAMFVSFALRPEKSDRALAEAAARLGVFVPAFSDYLLPQNRRLRAPGGGIERGLMLGFAPYSEEQIDLAVRTLARAAKLQDQRKQAAD